MELENRGGLVIPKSKSESLFHASSRRLKVGTFLPPTVGVEGDYGIFLTTSPVPHYTVADLVIGTDTRYFVYEVEALGKLRYNANWKELIAEQARVKRFVGVGKGILQNASKRFRYKEKDDDSYCDDGTDDIGSFVRHDAPIHGHKIRGRKASLQEILARS